MRAGTLVIGHHGGAFVIGLAYHESPIVSKLQPSVGSLHWLSELVCVTIRKCAVL